MYGEGRAPDRPLLLGSVKTNIGHLESAAGVAGVIKVLLSLGAGEIPPHLHYERPNPRIRWDELPVRVTSEAAPWPPGERPRRAGVSSFGYSGTNAHLVLEGYGGEPEAGAPSAEEGSREVRVLPLSARTPRGLRDLAGRYLEFLTEEAPLADVAWTAGMGRSHFGCRAGLVFRDLGSLRAQLEALTAGAGRDAAAGGKVAFLYTGQGSAWAGMGRELYAGEPVFREVLERCEAAFWEERGESLLAVMFGDAAGLGRTEWTQPALYALQSGLTALWASVGVRPDAVFGHSVGELAAARAAGVFGLEEGLRFASRRGELLGSLPAGGRMLAVFAPLAEVEEELGKTNARVRGVGLSLAAENGTHCVVSGPRRLVGSLGRRLSRRGVRTEELATSHAFHSGLVESALGDLESAAGSVSFGSPAVPVVSGVSGRVASPGEVEDAGYWRRQAREAVRFGTGVATLSELGVGVLVEIGPRAVLGPLAALSWPAAPGPVVVSSLKGEGGDGFASAVGAAYEAGQEITFAGLFAGERRRRVSVPTYPFQRERHWVRAGRRPRTGSGDALLGERHGSASGEVVFGTEWSSGSPGWLGEHRVHGRVVAPGALYGVQAAAALRASGSGAGSVLVEEVRIERPLVLPSGEESAGREVQVVLGRAGAGGRREFAVYSRDGEEDWVRHAAGQVGFGPESGEGFSEAARSALAARLAPAEVGELHAWLRSAGVEHGPSFRGLSRLWSGMGEALGEVRAPEGLGSAGAAPTVLLDACFRVLGGARDAEVEALEDPWLPVGWERLWLSGELPEVVWCRVGRREAAAEGGRDAAGDRVADLWLSDVDGHPVGEVRGLRLRPASRSALLAASAGIGELLYGEEWRESAAGSLRSARFLADPAVVAQRVRKRSAWRESAEDDAGGTGGAVEEIEAASRSYALNAFEALGWERRAGEGVDAEELRRALRVVEGNRRLFGRLLALLGDAGVLVAGERPGKWIAVSGSGDPPPAGLGDPEEQAAGLLARHPRASAEIGLLQRCGRALAEVLRGRVEGTELLFSGDPDAAAVYRDSAGYRAAAGALAEVVSGLVRRLPKRERLRVIEVGAGTGGSTGAVLQALPESRTSYTYTDLSPAFFAPAARRFGGVAAENGVRMEYRALDIERDPAAQGFAPHRSDLVIAANVLHATRDLGESLRHCRKLLAPSGVVLLLEGLERRGWLDLTFGLLPGWWRFDDRYRDDYPLVPDSVWRRAFDDAGFRRFAEVGLGEGQAVLAARGPAETAAEAGQWVVWSGAGTGQEVPALSRALAARGQEVVTLAAGEDPRRRESWRALFAGLGSSPPLRGVAHAEALAASGEETEPGAMWEGVRGLSASALALLQGLSDAGARPGLGVTFVTRGAPVLGADPESRVAGSVLWGLGRTAAREFGDVQVRLVDLDPRDAAGDDGARLAEELLYPDREEEVAVRAGMRRVRRLTRLALKKGAGMRRVRGERSYLVTGGLGGIGLRVAGWLGERGAGAVILNGRRAPEGPAAAAVAALRAQGVEVGVEIADVADAVAVAGMVAGLAERGLPPLGGVIHAAGVLSDRALLNQDAESFDKVLRPKVLGAWNLHEATLGLDLDLFVLFSGVTGWIGNAGQANHAAANAWLDGLAAWRRSRGLAGQAIAWGAWSGIGEAEEARERLSARFAALGAGWMTPEQGLGALDWLVQEDVPRSAAVVLDWGSVRISLPPVFEVLSAAAAAERELSSGDVLERLRAVEGAEREKILVDYLRAEVQSVLQLPAPPAVDSGFFELGMDSLMAVELRNRLSRALGAEAVVSSTVIFDYPEIVRLARHLASRMDPTPGAPPARSDSAYPETAREEYERARRMDDEAFFAEADVLLRSEENGEDPDA